MTSFFDAEFFSANRHALRAALQTDVPIVLTGNGAMQRGGDEPAAFYQDSNFWYLTGLSAPDLTLVMTKEETYLIVPELSAVREAFDGAHDSAAYAKRSGITTVLTEREGWQKLRASLRQSPSVATLRSSPEFLKTHGVYALPFRRRLIAKLKRVNPKLTIQDIRPELARLRCIKQPAELQALQRAIDITSATLQEVTKSDAFQRAGYEYELEAALSYGFRTRGAAGHAFAPIIGAGHHSVTLHHMENNDSIEPSDLIVLDVGAEVEHYAADLTRTVSQQPLTGRKAEVFQAVAAVQDYALSLIKPGMLMRDYELAVEAFMGTQLQKLGLITTPDRRAIRHYFPHATSHFLGLDTHDVGDYRLPLQAGMVITCEPGIYIPEESIGVRIEDDVLLTDTGHKVLSAACPRTLTTVK